MCSKPNTPFPGGTLFVNTVTVHRVLLAPAARRHAFDVRRCCIFHVLLHACLFKIEGGASVDEGSPTLEVSIENFSPPNHSLFVIVRVGLGRGLGVRTYFLV